MKNLALTKKTNFFQHRRRRDIITRGSFNKRNFTQHRPRKWTQDDGGGRSSAAAVEHAVWQIDRQHGQADL